MKQLKAFSKHGIIRGLNSTLKSSTFEGRFGRMFRTLAAAKHSPETLSFLAKKMVDSNNGPQTPETKIDDEENTGNKKNKGIAAGYTYLGQFLDHDITFDPASSLQQQNDPDSLVDFRTPRFDLDSLYGRGPSDQPYMYDFDAMDGNIVKMLLGKPLTGNESSLDPKIDTPSQDLPRNNPNGNTRRALTGDSRNDENVIVSQLHGMFLRFHNRVVDYQKDNGLDASFETVQNIVRWHYQWIILHDFLPTILGEDMVNEILPNLTNGKTINEEPPKLKFFNWHKEIFMPIEFSGAAYRFGHSMVRPIYRLNPGKNPKPVDPNDERFLVFPDLVGFGEFASNMAIDWRLFFDFGNNASPLSKEKMQSAYKIDTSLVNPLGNLPKAVADHIPPMPSLAELNLIRGMRLGLPSGQSVAKTMGLKVIPDNELKIGKATFDGLTENKAITDFKELDSIKGNTPLWFYVLAESLKNFTNEANEIIKGKKITDELKNEVNSIPVKLGNVGGRIVGEVFIGLLKADQYSYLNQDPFWTPIPGFMKNGRFGIVELITQAKH
ncbi:peroxidase family protein [Parasediminibacterium sp. JCM 36343]|uniref:peroxidase family protein n=1 Tax=Parasediminibacterium sp. JCM 36343 TaxID=3374279 RepID=UPI0039797A79